MMSLQLTWPCINMASLKSMPREASLPFFTKKKESLAGFKGKTYFRRRFAFNTL
jgi:hypothetical protein